MDSLYVQDSTARHAEGVRSTGSSQVNTGAAMSCLIHGENLQQMRDLEDKCSGRVGLAYIDPPFSTNSTFRVAADRAATISMESGSDVAYEDTVTGKEYFEALKLRLTAAHMLLSERGSLYLHIDSKVAYGLKAILDDVFGADNFRSSISRIKSNPKNFHQRGYGSVKDTILLYTKSDSYVWNEPRVPLGATRRRGFGKKDEAGRYTTAPLHAPGETMDGDTGREWRGMLPPVGRHWRYRRSRLDELDDQGLIEWSRTGNPRQKIYENDVARSGVLLQDVWEFKDPQYPQYPTEKNLEMLEVIIRTSSDPGDTVLDFYCGSGTALLAAARNRRRFIGIDSSDAAIACCTRRLAGYEYELIRA